MFAESYSSKSRSGKLNGLQESMRLHPIVPTIFRVADQDETLPLQRALIGKDGQPMSSIPVHKGQVINISIAAYNR